MAILTHRESCLCSQSSDPPPHFQSHPSCYLTALNSAALTGLSLRTVANLIADGTLRVKRVGRRTLIPRAELLRFCEVQETIGGDLWRGNNCAGSPHRRAAAKVHPALESKLNLLTSLRASARSRKSVLAPWQKQQLRVPAFELVRSRREGDTWEEAERLSGIDRLTAEALLPGAFYRDEHGRLQVREYDRYTRRLKIPNTTGEFRWLRARGSRQASLVGTWNNAVKAAGRGDFSLIDAFPRNVSIDGVRLATSHHEVSRIAAAVADSDEPFENIYSFVGAV